MHLKFKEITLFCNQQRAGEDNIKYDRLRNLMINRRQTYFLFPQLKHKNFVLEVCKIMDHDSIYANIELKRQKSDNSLRYL